MAKFCTYGACCGAGGLCNGSGGYVNGALGHVTLVQRTALELIASHKRAPLRSEGVSDGERGIALARSRKTSGQSVDNRRSTVPSWVRLPRPRGYCAICGDGSSNNDRGPGPGLEGTGQSCRCRDGGRAGVDFNWCKHQPTLARCFAKTYLLKSKWRRAPWWSWSS